jgi:hypothetical protein
MKTLVKSKFLILWLAAIFFMVVYSCIKQDIPVIDSGVALEVSVSELEGLELIDASTSSITADIILEDENGNEVLSNETITLTRRGETFKSTTISIDPGEYHLLEFKVNTDNLKSGRRSRHNYVYSYPSSKFGKKYFKVEKFWKRILKLLLKKHDRECDGGHFDCDDCGGCQDPCDDDDDDDDDDVPEGCETAFAYSADSLCFLNDNNLNSNRWGWTIPITEPVTDSIFRIIAGAGQCILSNGTYVGTLTIDYDAPTLTVKYDLDAPYTLDQIHVYAGPEKYPRKSYPNGDFTVAPGQYNVVDESPDSPEHTVQISTDKEGNSLGQNIWVIAHAVVCKRDE